MRSLETIQALHETLAAARHSGQRIGFVPTMGALHAGHRSLMQAARSKSDVVVVSIFVNPTQFGPQEDFSRYPRPIEADLEACRAEGVDLVFRPSVEEMYPSGGATMVRVSAMTEGLCGRHRPGHFDGVTTVVAKLFNVVRPDLAFFGQKDAQQAAVIRRMTRDLLWPMEIVVCPTVREADGLAMSSRNVYLSPEERRQALSLSGSLDWARQQIASGQRETGQLTRGMRERILAAGPCTIDYIEAVDAETLAPLATIDRPCLLALAVRIGSTRLIDNTVVDAH